MGSKGLVLSFKLAKIEKLLANQVGPYVTVYLYQVVRLAARNNYDSLYWSSVPRYQQQQAESLPRPNNCQVHLETRAHNEVLWLPEALPQLLLSTTMLLEFTLIHDLKCCCVTPMISFVPTGIFSAPPFLQIHQRSQFLSFQNIRVSTQD